MRTNGGRLSRPGPGRWPSRAFSGGGWAWRAGGPPGKMPRTRVAGAPRCGASEQGEAPGWQLYPASDS